MGRATSRRSRRKGLPVDVYMLKRHLGPAGATIVVALILLVMLADRSGLINHSSDWDTYHNKTFLVTSVVDGDTLHVDHPDGSKSTTTIRFWGIDTPEIRHNASDPPDQPWAQEAKIFATEHALGKQVTLLLEPHDQRGKYGRLLAYVILPDGRSLNEMLIEEGLAKADMRFSHHLLNEYDELQKKAKREHKGIWSRSQPVPSASK